jgi:RNA polymerase sigma factor (sigma-70 family)
MDANQALAERFEEHRIRPRAVAYRMLGSLSEADDAVQEAWLRLSGAEAKDVENLGGWLTTVVARVCLNMLRSRRTRPEVPLDPHVPDPVVSPEAGVKPEDKALLADSVGLALLVVLDALPPAERLAFVLHDMFAVPFDEIGPMVGRSPAAARQLASRARRRLQEAPTPDRDPGRQRAVVDAFFAAARGGDFEALVAVLDPEIVLRSDHGTLPGSAVVRGPQAVAAQALGFADPSRTVHPALVNGAAGVVIAVDGKPVAIVGFTVVNDRIIAIDALADPERIGGLDLGSSTTGPAERKAVCATAHMPAELVLSSDPVTRQRDAMSGTVQSGPSTRTPRGLIGTLTPEHIAGRAWTSPEQAKLFGRRSPWDTASAGSREAGFASTAGLAEYPSERRDPSEREALATPSTEAPT